MAIRRVPRPENARRPESSPENAAEPKTLEERVGKLERDFERLVGNVDRVTESMLKQQKLLERLEERLPKTP